MQRLMARIKGLYFNGDTRKGPRSSFIFKELERRGCEPEKDRYGNIWVKSGSGNPSAVFSSHMDIDPRISRKEFKRIKNGNKRVLSGVLDNAVGCALNVLLASEAPQDGSALHIFTASEEISARNPRIFARSAKEVVRQLKAKKIRPKMCVAIDVTYPKLKVSHDRIDWSRDDDEIFYLMDKTHCYLDGYCNRASRSLAIKLADMFGDNNVRVRNLPGHDEAVEYMKIAPSFAFGPVVFGSFDQPWQSMPFSHAKTALRFLRFAKAKASGKSR